MKGPREILFKRIYNLRDGSEGPLFKSQKDLAENIVRLKEGYDNADSLKPFLSQVLKDKSDPRYKPMPNKLLVAIIKAGVLRLYEKYNQSFTSDISRAFENENKKLSKKPGVKYEDPIFEQWRRFMRAHLHAKTVYIFTPYPIELHWSENARALKLMAVIFNELHFYQKDFIRPEFDQHIPTHLNYYFPDISTTIAFWKNLKKFLSEIRGFNQIAMEEYFTSAVQENKIQTFTINKDQCITPLYFFDTINNEKDLVSYLFSLSIFDNNDLNVMEYSYTDKERWYEAKLLPILADPATFGVKEITYQSIKHLI